MKVVAKLFAFAAVAISFAAHSGERKETVIDAGRVHIVASVPVTVQGPTRFNGEEGILVFDNQFGKGREAAFIAKVSEINGILRFHIKVEADSTDPKFYDAKRLTEYMVSKIGYKFRDISQIDPPKLSIKGATIFAYQFSGKPFNGKDKGVGYLVVVSVPSAHSGFAYLVEGFAPSATFDKNAAVFDEMAFSQIMDFKKFSTFEVH
jgi:hypothetical protein